MKQIALQTAELNDLNAAVGTSVKMLVPDCYDMTIVRPIARDYIKTKFGVWVDPDSLTVAHEIPLPYLQNFKYVVWDKDHITEEMERVKS